MKENLINKSTAKVIYIAVALFVACLIVRQVLLGSTSIVRLNPSSYLSGAISQALASTSINTEEGINYSISSENFFDNNSYVSVIVKPLRNSSYTGIIVFKKLDGLYAPILGPGTEINVNYLISLPKDLTNYLINSGYTYEPTY
jgi:hypothetical protein